MFRCVTEQVDSNVYWRGAGDVLSENEEIYTILPKYTIRGLQAKLISLDNYKKESLEAVVNRKLLKSAKWKKYQISLIGGKLKVLQKKQPSVIRHKPNIFRIVDITAIQLSGNFLRMDLSNHTLIIECSKDHLDSFHRDQLACNILWKNAYEFVGRALHAVKTDSIVTETYVIQHFEKLWSVAKLRLLDENYQSADMKTALEAVFNHLPLKEVSHQQSIIAIISKMGVIFDSLRESTELLVYDYMRSAAEISSVNLHCLFTVVVNIIGTQKELTDRTSFQRAVSQFIFFLGSLGKVHEGRNNWPNVFYFMRALDIALSDYDRSITAINLSSVFVYAINKISISISSFRRFPRKLGIERRYAIAPPCQTKWEVRNQMITDSASIFVNALTAMLNVRTWTMHVTEAVKTLPFSQRYLLCPRFPRMWIPFINALLDKNSSYVADALWQEGNRGFLSIVDPKYSSESKTLFSRMLRYIFVHSKHRGKFIREMKNHYLYQFLFDSDAMMDIRHKIFMEMDRLSLLEGYFRAQCLGQRQAIFAALPAFRV